MPNEFKLTKDNLGCLITELTKVVNTGKVLKITWAQWREKRSISQNGTYWMWLGEIAKNKQASVNGKMFSDEVWHEYFLKYYCPEKDVEAPNSVLKVRSTKLLDKGEMHHYLTRVDLWAQSHSISLTMPEKSEYKQYIEEQER